MENKKTYNPFVSIAMATYNRNKYLVEQLDSILNQTYSNFELVISDDGSTDGAEMTLKEYQKKDARIKLARNTHERGVTSNFSEAIKRCRGDIIFLADCDDVWDVSKIAEHMLAYQDVSVQWVYNEVVLTDEYRDHIGYITDTLPDYWTRKKLLFYTWGSCVLGCATSYRTHLIKDIWPADDFAPAHDSWIQLVIYPAKRRYIPKVLQEYRQHSQNISGFIGSKTYEKKASETLAIQNNLKYLKSLFRNSHLQGWKRIFLFIVYVAKNIRLLFT